MTTDQLSLLASHHGPAANELEARYRAWRETHPEVYAIFREKAIGRLATGRRFGIGQLTEVVRWEVARAWEDDEAGFRINNNFRAYIARDLIAEIPALGALIETRELRA